MHRVVFAFNPSLAPESLLYQIFAMLSQHVIHPKKMIEFKVEFAMVRIANQTFNAVALKLEVTFNGPNERMPGI